MRGLSKYDVGRYKLFRSSGLIKCNEMYYRFLSPLGGFHAPPGRLHRVSVTVMTAKEILAFITEIGIVPVVRAASAEHAIQAVEACYNGGIRAAEITMTVPGAVRALEKVADKLGDKIMLGAGTVLDPETARVCMLAGAQFFVTPSLRVSTIEMCKR